MVRGKRMPTVIIATNIPLPSFATRRFSIGFSIYIYQITLDDTPTAYGGNSGWWNCRMTGSRRRIARQ